MVEVGFGRGRSADGFTSPRQGQGDGAAGQPVRSSRSVTPPTARPSVMVPVKKIRSSGQPNNPPLSTSSSGLVSGEVAMNATIGADGVRVASVPSTIAVVPHGQNGVSVREHDRGTDGCPAPLRQPAAEPVGSQVHPNRGRRPARASRRRPSDRRPHALRGARGELSALSCAGVASPGRADPAWSPGTPASRSPRIHVRGERPRRWLRGQSMRQAHATGVKRCRLGRVPANNRGTRCPQNPL
jgi:hypothetical protein